LSPRESSPVVAPVTSHITRKNRTVWVRFTSKSS